MTVARGFIWTALVASVCTGCGPVNLSSLSPEVWKPSALFIVNGQLGDWSPARIQRLGQENHIVTKAVYAPGEGNVLQRMKDAVVETPNVGLYVVVSPTPADAAVQSFAESHVGVRVEWVSPSQAGRRPQVNLRTVSQSDQVLAYLGGWLAASIASSSLVGWDLSPTGSFNRLRIVEAALAGAYMVNPTFQSEPFSLSQQSSVVAPASGWPSAVVTDHPIDANSLSIAASHHVVVISLVEQGTPSNLFLVNPEAPNPASIQPDLVKYHSSRWTAGVRQTVSGTVLDISRLGLIGTVGDGYNAQLSLVKSDATWPQSVWNMVPANLQKSFLALVSK